MEPLIVLPLHLDFGLVKIKVGHFDNELWDQKMHEKSSAG
jgi:hypothetical protein